MGKKIEEGKGYVYLLGDNKTDGIFKIGVTKGSLEARMKKLQTGNSGEIYLVDYFQTDYPFYIEKRMHSKYTSKNVLNEWYELSATDITNFRQDCQTFNNIVLALKDNPFFKP